MDECVRVSKRRDESRREGDIVSSLRIYSQCILFQPLSPCSASFSSKIAPISYQLIVNLTKDSPANANHCFARRVHASIIGTIEGSLHRLGLWNILFLPSLSQTQQSACPLCFLLLLLKQLAFSLKVQSSLGPVQVGRSIATSSQSSPPYPTKFKRKAISFALLLHETIFSQGNVFPAGSG